MGNNEITEKIEKKSADEEDQEIDEWMKLSNDLHWEPRQAYDPLFMLLLLLRRLMIQLHVRCFNFLQSSQKSQICGYQC